VGCCARWLIRSPGDVVAYPDFSHSISGSVYSRWGTPSCAPNVAQHPLTKLAARENSAPKFAVSSCPVGRGIHANLCDKARHSVLPKQTEYIEVIDKLDFLLKPLWIRDVLLNMLENPIWFLVIIILSISLLNEIAVLLLGNSQSFRKTYMDLWLFEKLTNLPFQGFRRFQGFHGFNFAMMTFCFSLAD